MKKLLYSLAAIAALVLAASCEQEKLVGQDNADLVEVTFNVGMPEAVATKAISDGTQATELLFFAFDGNGKYLANVKPAEAVTVTGYKAAVTVKLIKGMTYNFVFWAQTPGKYTELITATNGEVGASLDISTVAAAMMNDDSFDAFYGRIKNYKVERAFSTEFLYLTRPFAQLNVGAYADDIEAAQASNIETGADKMSTKYFQTADGISVNTTLNLLTGEAGGATMVDLNAANRPAEDLQVGTDAPYTWIAMLYLLQSAPDYYGSDLAYVDENEEKSTEEEVSFNIATKQNGDDVTTDRIVYNVPLQRNYRTNILGNIFSVDGTFNIMVDQNFQKVGDPAAEQPYLPEYADIAALNTAFASDASDAAKWSYKVKLLAAGDVKEIKLPDTTDPVDIVFADGAWTNENISVVYAAADALKPTKLTLKVDRLASLTANLPQTTITVVEGSLIDLATITSAPHTFIIEKEAEVTNLIILGGGLKVEGTIGDAEVKPENAPITDVVIADGAAVEGTLAVSGGEVTVEENAVVEKLVVEGTATAEVNTAATVGEIVADNPAAVTDENNDPVDDVVAAIKSGAALKAAFEAGGTVTVDADITDGQGLFLAAATPKTVVLDLNEHTVEFVGPAVGSAGTQTQALHLEKGSTVTIKNGTLKLGASADGIKMFIQNYSELTLEDVIVDFTGSGYSYALSNNFGHITITGATEITVDPGKTAFDLWYGMASSYADGVYVTFDENFTGTVNGNIEYGAASWGRNQEGWQDKAVLTIKGEGTFNGSFAEGNTGGLVGANINIYSGKFSSDPSAYAIAGYTGELGTDNYWTIVEKTIIDAEIAIVGDVPASMDKDDEFEVTVTTNSDAAIQYNAVPAAAVTVTPGDNGAYTIKANEVDSDTNVEVTFFVEETAAYSAAQDAVQFTVNKPIVYTTIAELKALVTSGSTAANIADVYVKDAVVTAINGSNYYIEDETAGLVFYGSFSDLAAGKKFTAKLTGLQGKTYNGLKEITAATFENFSSEDATVTEITLTTAELAANFDTYDSRRVKVESVDVPSAVQAKNSSATLSDNIVLFASGDLENGIAARTVNTIVGYATRYIKNTTDKKEIAIWSDDMVTYIKDMPAETTLTVSNAEITIGATEPVQISYTVNPTAAPVVFSVEENDLIEVSESGSVSLKANASVDANTDVTVTATVVATNDYTAAEKTAKVTVKPASQGGGNDPEPVEVLNDTFDNELENDATNEISLNDYPNWSAKSKVYKGAGGTLKFGSSKAGGSLTSKSLDLSGTFTVSIDVKQYGSDSGDVTVKVGEQEKTITPTTDFDTSVLNFNAETSSSSIIISTAKRAYIDNVVVTVTYSE